MKSLSSMSVILTLAIVLCSCGPRLYFPDRANVPGFKKAGEIKAVASVKPQSGTVESRISPAADVAYAPINHLGIVASWRSLDGRLGYLYPTFDKPSNYSSNNTEVYLNGNRFEAGAGYFTNIGHRGIFEAYAGYGNGQLNAGDQRGRSSFFHTKYNRFFAQSEAGFSNNIVSLMAGIQLASQRYYGFTSGDSALRYTIAAPRSTQRPVDFTSETFWFIEPFVNCDVGYKWIFFNAQLGFAGQMGTTESIIGDSNVFLSIGATFRFNIQSRLQ